MNLGFYAGGGRLANAFAVPTANWEQLQSALASGKHVIVICSGPTQSLAADIRAGRDPQNSLSVWESEARALLAASEFYGERVTLLLAEEIEIASRESLTALKQRFSLETDAARLVGKARYLVYDFVAAEFIATLPDIAALGRSLAERAKKLTERFPTSADPAAVIASLASLTNEAEKSREEAQLLRAHLHVVQSQVETYYQRARLAGSVRTDDGQSASSALKNELAAARAELEKYRSSLSWRMTAPVRALASLLPRNLSPTGIRLHRQIKLIRNSAFFDADWYLDKYTDLASSGVDPAEHYLISGWREGRRPSPDFDGPGYLRVNPDVAAKGLNPLVHYLQYGRDEGRPMAPRLTKSDAH